MQKCHEQERDSNARLVLDKTIVNKNTQPIGVKVSDEEINALNIIRDYSHGEWNYTIKPNYEKFIS